ncbi:uncharacterized protein LOC131049143 isoform X2 [Cryptomeria japonica]|uniref:uncharacterized protein LOC131049143 isoform X2 n=1 Tax=Cryptomeria japonica TaxID=3369 RepID=UPI0025AC4343|nr:uncharacterized protein LOC131049143 isoform X2 [Cryptomeria japonica]
MVGWEMFDAVIWYASNASCTKLAIAVQIQGCIICLILALGWALAATVRGKELKRIKDAEKDGHSLAFLYPNINDLEHSAQERLPRVSVVMPLKGFGEHNYSNWKSQLVSLYGGPLEFLFVVESTDDPAYPVVSQLILDFKNQVDAKVVVAGLSTTCSQKIHNQLAGVERMHKDSKYVLFLDDDARLHPGSLGALTAEMEKNPEIFIQTGYPFDIPSGSLGSYCIYEYHMPCSMGFATGGRTFFLWGGCMMMHADDFRTDRYGLVTGLRNGGYSDDMTLAAVAGAHKRLISSPPVAIFVHPLSSDLTFSRYWNYLRKQTFVLESYNTNVNWMMNRGLFIFHCYCSWGYVSPFVMAFFHLIAAFRCTFSNYPFSESAVNTGLILVGCLAVCTVIEIISVWNITRVEIELCNALSPEEPRVSISQYNWGLVLIAMVVDNFLYPLSAFYSHFTQYIDWSGVRYHLKNGKISQIQRHPDCGTKPLDKGTRRQNPKANFFPQGHFISSIVRTIVYWNQPKKFDI